VIVLNLACAAGHRFEGWFASLEAFETQLSRALVSCPHCESTAVSRLPSGPHVAKPRSAHPSVPVGSEDGSVVEVLMEQLRRMGEAGEDVGDRFPEEARRMHYGDSDKKSVRGQASLKEMGELLEEGIPVLPLPAKRTKH
jgi:hypothetical protein